MKNISRKVLSILLIIFLLTPSVITFASYGEDSITLIEELGLAKESKFAYFQKNYTRADFAYILCQCKVNKWHDKPHIYQKSYNYWLNKHQKTLLL